MNTTETITTLNSAMRRFDEKAKPFGLYAISESPDQSIWRGVFQPTLAKLGYHEAKKRQSQSFPSGLCFRKMDGSRLWLQFESISKIKVRKYGNAYRVDPHHDFAKRWQDANLAAHLERLSTEETQDERVLLFLGFANEAEAFEEELAGLALKTRAITALSKAKFATESWIDPHGRKFRTICACWAWEAHRAEVSAC